MSEHEPSEAAPARSLPATDDDADAAFTAFYRETVKELVGFLILQGANVADAAEIAQDTLIAAFARWDTIYYPRAWVYRVASRALIRTLTSIEVPVDEPKERSPLLTVTADIEVWEQQQDIGSELALLPWRQRQVMAWTLYGYKPAEIAHEFGMTPEAVRASLMKARRALAARLAAKEGTT